MGSTPSVRAMGPGGQGLHAGMVGQAGTAAPAGAPPGTFIPVQPTLVPQAFPRAPVAGGGSLPNPDAGRANLAGLMRLMQGGGGAPSQFGRGGSSPGYSTSGRGGSFGGKGSSARGGGLY